MLPGIIPALTALNINCFLYIWPGLFPFITVVPIHIQYTCHTYIFKIFFFEEKTKDKITN